jgi:hypothetical protein
VADNKKMAKIAHKINMCVKYISPDALGCTPPSSRQSGMTRGVGEGTVGRRCYKKVAKPKPSKKKPSSKKQSAADVNNSLKGWTAIARYLGIPVATARMAGPAQLSKHFWGFSNPISSC